MSNIALLTASACVGFIAGTCTALSMKRPPFAIGIGFSVLAVSLVALKILFGTTGFFATLGLLLLVGYAKEQNKLKPMQQVNAQAQEQNPPVAKTADVAQGAGLTE